MHRNEYYFNKEKQIKRVLQWCKEVKRKVEEDEPPQVQLFVKRSKLNIERCSADTIENSTHDVKNLIQKVEMLSKGDI